MPTDGLLCWSCGRPTGLTGKVFRNDECPNCSASLRACRGCRHFDPTRRYQCRESIDSAVRNKDKANYCDYYQPRNVVKTAGGLTYHKDSKESRKQQFDSLFDD